jgi:hypothetical protein
MVYKFRHRKTEEHHEVEMPMSDYIPYKGPDGDDDQWERIYEAPQINMGVSTSKNIDAWDSKSFVERTGKMKGTYGELQDHASELSEKRAKESLTGEDPVKRKYLDNYSKKRGGKKHVADLKKKIENKHIRVDL